MAKKRRSAKQRANDKRLGRMAKARARKSTPKRRRSRSKVNKPRKRPKTMAKRRSSSSKSNVLGKIPLINNPTFKKAATGIGVATLGAAVLTLVVPQLANQPLVKPILALAGGGVPGVVAQFLVSGGVNLGSLLRGGRDGGAVGGGPGNIGFA